MDTARPLEPVTPPALLHGHHGQYRLVRRLSSGGAAEVFLAENVAAGAGAADAHVVVKCLHEPAGVPALLAEARLNARLDHPGIARALDLAEGPNGPSLVLECLHGEDVDHVLDEVRRTGQRVPFGIAARIAADVAAALHHAHERAAADGTPLSVVHRDVTPDNVVVTYAGDVKLLDFGIAKWIGAADKTELGYVKGKAPYLSPEQCLQATVDRRSDVFSMGTLLYELTTLRAPFGDTLGDDEGIMQRIVEGRYTPPDQLVADYPPDLAAIIARCLAPARELRHRDAGELRDELRAVIAAHRWAASAADLAVFLRKLFGERSPPWLDDPPTRIAGVEPPPPPVIVEDDATVIGPPAPRLIAAIGGEAPAVEGVALEPLDDETLVTPWAPPPPVAPAARPASAPAPAPSVTPAAAPAWPRVTDDATRTMVEVAPAGRPWSPARVAVACAATLALALALARLW